MLGGRSRREGEGRRLKVRPRGKDRGLSSFGSSYCRDLVQVTLFFPSIRFLEVILARVFYACHIEKKKKHQHRACCHTVGLQHVGTVSLHTTDE